MTRTTLSAAFVAAAIASAASAAEDRGLASYDAVADAPFAPSRRDLVPAHASPLVRQDAPAHRDHRLGLPTFLWAAPTADANRTIALRLARPEVAARAHLVDFAPLYGLTAAEAQAAELAELHDTGQGAIIARFKQSVNGIPVFRDELRIAMDRELRPVAVSGYLSPDAAAFRAAPAPFTLEARDAVTRGLSDLRGLSLAADAFDAGAAEEGGYVSYSPKASLPGGVRLVEPARTMRVLFHLPDHLEPAHYVELHVGAEDSVEAEYYAYVFSAVDGRLLYRNDMTAHDSFGYKVWAGATAPYIPLDGPQGHTGSTPKANPVPDKFQPAFIAPTLVTLQNSPFHCGTPPVVCNDPWLAPGATETSGNNVDAYADLASPDGFTANSADLRATVTAAGVFDRTYDVTTSPSLSSDQRMAAITQLFFNVNFFHDWYYDAGFNEAAGNGQVSNYSRGGLGGDPVKAEAQDSGGTNNANMTTPADGKSPKMQMYVWKVARLSLAITAPAAIAGELPIAGASFGPQVFDVNAQVVAANDGTAPDANDACEPLANAAALAGKIALINRSRNVCGFTQKVRTAQAAGAVGVIIANTEAGLNPMGGAAGENVTDIRIPAVMILQTDGDKIRAQLASGVTAHLFAASLLTRDGTIDNQIIAHEWGHYISNRLISDANGLNTNQARGMGEGWADFHAMLMTVRAGDNAVASNATWNGVYALASYASFADTDDNYYYGIRRAPYSTDLTKNPLTFKHITNGVPLPTTAPIAFGASGANNAEVHNAGEIWGQMLWECYASLLRSTLGGSPRLTFQQAQDRMKGYIVGGYKLTPPNPTFLEARDAILAAAFANDPADYALLVAAFAKRGAGTRAVAADRFDQANLGVVESFEGGNDVQVVSAIINDSTTAVCTADGKLDAGETGVLTITVKNDGAGALGSITAAVTSADAKLTFPSGNALTFAATAPFAQAVATVPIKLDPSASGVLALTLSIAFPTGLTAPLVATVVQRGNYDAVAGQSASDDFEAAATPWTLAGNAALDTSQRWEKVTLSPVDHRFRIKNLSVMADQSLVSPKLQVGAGAPLMLTFKHRFDLIVAQTTAGESVAVDGGVLEISQDNGVTWVDLSSLTPFNYPGTISELAKNPIGARPAFVDHNPAFPAQDTVSINLGDKLAGKAILLRFRLGTIGLDDSFGWEVDDVSISGLANLPFPKLVGRTGTACNRAPTANAGAAQSVKDGVAVKLDGRASSDPDSDPLTYRWVQQSGAAATLDDATSATPGFTAPKVRGSQPVVFALFVNDGKLTSAPATVTVTVSHDNQAPTANAGPAQTGLKAASTVSLDGSGSTDPDDDPLTFAWTQVGGTAVTLTGATTVNPTFTAPGGGDVTLQLVVSDGIASSAPATVKISVKGGGCSSAGSGSVASLLPLVLAAWALRRRRRA